MNCISISNGELLDRYTILLAKMKNIKDNEKRKNVSEELELLQKHVKKFSTLNEFITDLLSVNNELWNLENQVREFEKLNKFDEKFIECCRKIFKLNDLRFSYKQKINKETQSLIIDEKEHL
jgi:hypothetical protein